MKHKVCVILGEACGYDDPKDTKQQLVEGYGSHAMRIFKTAAEAKAYLAGLADMSGLDGYDVVPPDYYDKVVNIKGRA